MTDIHAFRFIAIMVLTTVTSTVACLAAADSGVSVAAQPAADAIQTEMLLFQTIPPVYTASRVEQLSTEAPASVSVITHEQIVSSGAISIPDLLRMVPGVDVIQSTGANWDVSVRGFVQPMSNKVLVMVDGRTVYNDLYAVVNWYALPIVLEDIERIEIIRGPLSSLWGANAYLGVINILTRPAASTRGVLATVQDGTRGTFRANVLGGGQAGPGLYYKASLAREEVGQWPASSPLARLSPVDTPHAGEVTKANVALEWDRGEQGKLSFSGGFSDSSSVMAVDLQPMQRLAEETSNYANVTYRRGHTDINAYWNRDRSDLTTAGLGTSRMTTNLLSLELVQDRQAGRHSLVYGAGYRHKSLGQSGVQFFSGGRSQDLWAAYLEDTYQASPTTTAVASMRYDRHPLTGNSVSGRGTVMYSPAAGRTWRLSVADAFRNPAFVESYLNLSVPLPPPMPTLVTLGNTDLEPERVVTVDLEYRAEPTPGTAFSACVYYTALRDLILLETDPLNPTQDQFRNLARASSTGVELDGRLALSATLWAFANYTYQTLGLEVPPPQEYPRGLLLGSSPRHKANVGFTLVDPAHGLQGSLLVNYRGATPTLGPDFLVNGYLGKKVSGDAELGISFFNLLDARHQEFAAGDFIGRRVMASLRWQF